MRVGIPGLRVAAHAARHCRAALTDMPQLSPLLLAWSNVQRIHETGATDQG
jgi:hypothetical protein